MRTIWKWIKRLFFTVACLILIAAAVGVWWYKWGQFTFAFTWNQKLPVAAAGSSTTTIPQPVTANAEETALEKLRKLVPSGVIVTNRNAGSNQRVFGEVLAAVSVPSTNSQQNVLVSERFIPADYLLVPTWQQQLKKLGGDPTIEVPLFKGEVVGGTKDAPPVDIELDPGYTWFKITDKSQVIRSWKHSVDTGILWGRKKE